MSCPEAAVVVADVIAPASATSCSVHLDCSVLVAVLTSWMCSPWAVASRSMACCSQLSWALFAEPKLLPSSDELVRAAGAESGHSIVASPMSAGCARRKNDGGDALSVVVGVVAAVKE